MRRNEFWRIILTLVVCWTSASTAATPGRERGATSQVRIEGFDPLIPTLRKWYVPQDLYYIYNWGGYKYTNYARDHFARYVSTELEGRGRYDIFGNWVTRGWELYDWREEHPLAFGSSVFKDSRYGSWFQNLVVAADSKGQYFTALTIGDAIRTTLTPLTFSRSNFNGMQWDFMSDKYQVTVLRSRVSEPVRLAGFSDTDQRSDVHQFDRPAHYGPNRGFHQPGLCFRQYPLRRQHQQFFRKLASRPADQQSELGQYRRNHHPHHRRLTRGRVRGPFLFFHNGRRWRTYRHRATRSREAAGAKGSWKRWQRPPSCSASEYRIRC